MKKLISTTVIAGALLLGTAPAAEAAPAKTPKACKTALNLAQQAISISSDMLTTLNGVIQVVPDALQAAFDRDGDALSALTEKISSAPDVLTAGGAKIEALTERYQRARDKCLAG